MGVLHHKKINSIVYCIRISSEGDFINPSQTTGFIANRSGSGFRLSLRLHILMPKRKLRSDSAREKGEDACNIRLRLAEIVSLESENRKMGISIRKKRERNSVNPPSLSVAENLTRSSCVGIPRSIPSTAQQSTISGILAVISKSLSGLRLRQGSITPSQIPPEHQTYASAISRSPLLADKLLAFRASGPSFNAIRNTLLLSEAVTPLSESNPLFLTRWMNMRLFAFGHPGLISALGTVEIPRDVISAREAYKKSSGLGINSLPVYGNVRFDPKRVPGYVDRLFTDGPKLSTAMAKAKERGGGVILFNEMMKLIQEGGVPYHSSGTLFQWLLACDLAELNASVAPPTARDLAYRIECCAKRKKGGSGAWNGLVKDIEEHDWPELTVDNLTNYLEDIYWGVKEGLGTQEVLFGVKGFWYSDLEHCLCKVTRAAKY